MEQKYKFFAFISYSSHDTAWGKRLQDKLEGYRMPATLCSERGWKRKPINPVFFAPTDIQPGELTEELQERLRASKNLIVICSPASAKSEWVGKEIAFFHSLGRTNNIYFFIIDGIPHSGDSRTECFNPVIKSLGLPEILGANVNEKIYRWPWLNRERAYVQIVTKLLGVEFDSIWQRHRRMLRRKITLWTVGILVVVSTVVGVWIKSQPVDVIVSLRETTTHNDNLPPLSNAVVTLEIENETKTDTIHTLGTNAIFANIPHHALGKKARLNVECREWLPVDTTVVLGTHVTLTMSRDPHCYGDIVFRLWSMNRGCGVANTQVTIEGINAISDERGYIRMTVPLEKQKERYEVKSDLPLENNILTMPTTASRALLVQD